VIIGGLKGQFIYDDESFDDLDPDIQRMFYEDDDLDTVHVSVSEPGR
jgi:hypothetical protein